MTATAAADIAAVQMMMERFGLTAADLATGTPADNARPTPTFAEFIPATTDRMPAGRTRDHYCTYWNKILAQPRWGERRLDEPTPADLQVLCEQIRAARVIRRSDRGGNEVVRHVIDALRKLYKHAEDHRIIDPRDNPAARLTKPKRTRSNRRALPTELLAQIVEVAATTGNDPELDSLILRLHTETACRRAGALALRPRDLDPVQSVILLREKGGTQLWQPVSPTLMQALCRHAEQRGAPESEQLLRARNGNPVTRRRYNHLFERLGQHLPWVLTHGIPSTGYATPPSPGSNATTAPPSRENSPATATAAGESPASTPPPPSPRSPPPSPISPESRTHWSPRRVLRDRGMNEAVGFSSPAL